jgi:NAD(P)-dependent dehydrogenase (short-subunit alcohol dehydrogenase family)
MSRPAVLITGAAGGIGCELCRVFRDANWRVVATDHRFDNEPVVDSRVDLDLERFCRDNSYRSKNCALLRKALDNNRFAALINNAATQIVRPIEQISVDDWRKTLDVNLVAPALLSQEFLPDLEASRGSIINISSVHATLTKPGFTAYASSKSALVGLTRALAVEVGHRVRVNAICPAAIETPMLKAGFASGVTQLERLAAYHPTHSLGTPTDVAELALFLAESKSAFLNGAVIGLDGGIASRLHDPE